MGFIHHTTGAAGATGLMAESARPQGSVSFGHPRPSRPADQRRAHR